MILASASPRRRALLHAAGVSFTVQAADVDESVLPGEDAADYARRVAAAKAEAVPGDVVLAADTVVALDGRVYGKPATPEEARATLRALSGRTHQVYTAVALRILGRTRVRLVVSRVRFRALSERDLDWYVATGEPMDKAGAYGIQGEGMALVDRLWGSYTNVMGLPLKETLAMLERTT